MTRSRARVLTLALLTATAPLALPRVARAQAGDPQQQATIAKIVDLNREAIAQYQRKHFDNARKVLRQALELCESSGLDHHPVAARTHIHLGIVILAGYGQRDIATKQFSDALAIQPDIALTPGLETPAAQEAFNEAAVGETPRSPAAAVASGDDSSPAAPARDDEAATPIQPFTGVSSQGSEGSDDGVPRTTRHAKAPSDEDDATDDDRGRLQFGALLGGGVGWASGMGDVNADTPVPGTFAGAKLGHLQLEAGYWFKPELMLSLQGRFQKVTGATVVEAPDGHVYQPATGATAVFAAATWSPVKGHLRPYLSGAIGGGHIRHVVTLPTLHDCGAARNQTCVDTVAAGPFLAGVGGGLTYDLTDNLELVAALNTQVGAPDFTFNVDLNAGLAFRL